MINLTWLRSFCTLAEVGHFTRTAERLNMTQSGVSQHVRKLEQQLDTELLLREGKQFSLTGAGRRLYEESQEVLQALSNLEQKVREDAPFEGIVRLMSPGSVGLRLYPQLLQMQSRHPGLIIDYRFAPNADAERSIAESSIDIGFMTVKSILPEVNSKAVAEEPLLLVTPAQITDPDWASLMQLGFIGHPDGNHHADMLLSANYPEFQHVQQFPVKGFSNQVSLILEPVSRGLGFTVLPAYAVEAFGKPELISVHSLSEPVCETLYLCSRHNRVPEKRVEVVIAEALRCL